MLLSIIIPTKNRYQPLIHLIEALRGFQDDDFEVVIQDNSEDNAEFIDIARKLPDRVRYFHYSGYLTGCGNFDKAILNSNGEYVCIIGDDDGFSAKMLKLVRWMKNNNVDSCIFPTADYVWPGFRTSRIHNITGLGIPEPTGKIERLSPENELISHLKTGAFGWGKLPRVYHGIVSRSALDAVYSKLGTFFPGPVPDLSNAVALCFAVKSHCRVHTPYIVSGRYYGIAKLGEQDSSADILASNASVPNDVKENWEEKNPPLWVAATIWAECAIKTLKKMGKENYLQKFNYSRLYAMVFSCHREQAHLAKPLIKGLKAHLSVALSMTAIFINRCYLFGANFLRANFRISRKKLYTDVPTIREAIALVDKHISDDISEKRGSSQT